MILYSFVKLKSLWTPRSFNLSMTQQFLGDFFPACLLFEIDRFIWLGDRLGLDPAFANDLTTHLQWPRNHEGKACRQISYYERPRPPNGPPSPYHQRQKKLWIRENRHVQVSIELYRKHELGKIGVYVLILPLSASKKKSFVRRYYQHQFVFPPFLHDNPPLDEEDPSLHYLSVVPYSLGYEPTLHTGFAQLLSSAFHLVHLLEMI